MKRETEQWLKYADENLQSAKVLMDSGLFNPCLQNIQQAIEKYLKAVLTERDLGLIKTHSIRTLINILTENGISLSSTDDEIDLIDSIYLPSKYPAFSVLPDFVPDLKTCMDCFGTLERLKEEVLSNLNREGVAE